MLLPFGSSNTVVHKGRRKQGKSVHEWMTHFKAVTQLICEYEAV